MCNIIVLNVHDPTEETSDNTKGNFYEQLQHVLNQFRKYHMNTLLGDCNAKTGTEGNLNQQSGMRSYMKLVVIMNYCIKLHHVKNLSRAQCSHFATFTNTLLLLFMRKCINRLITS